MPAFGGQLTNEEIDAVAAYVADAAAQEPGVSRRGVRARRHEAR